MGTCFWDISRGHGNVLVNELGPSRVDCTFVPSLHIIVSSKHVSELCLMVTIFYVGSLSFFIFYGYEIGN